MVTQAHTRFSQMFRPLWWGLTNLHVNLSGLWLHTQIHHRVGEPAVLWLWGKNTRSKGSAECPGALRTQGDVICRTTKAEGDNHTSPAGCRTGHTKAARQPDYTVDWLQANTQGVTKEKEKSVCSGFKEYSYNNPFWPGLVMQGLVNPALGWVGAREKKRGRDISHPFQDWHQSMQGEWEEGESEYWVRTQRKQVDKMCSRYTANEDTE